MTDAMRPFRQLARNAWLANARLSTACMALKPDEWEAPRTSFFPSLKLTMLHLLNADRFYIDALSAGHAGLARGGMRESPSSFARERAGVDEWLVNFCEALTAQGMARKVTIPWPEMTITETAADTLLHVFLHGQHHRGQIHAMLSGTSVPPPQIDEFILTGDRQSRVDELARLGWTESRFTQ
jgi:uncharacterized damage-inducible protein DinB